MQYVTSAVSLPIFYCMQDISLLRECKTFFSHSPNDLLHPCRAHIKNLQAFQILQSCGPDVANY